MLTSTHAYFQGTHFDGTQVQQVIAYADILKIGTSSFVLVSQSILIYTKLHQVRHDFIF